MSLFKKMFSGSDNQKAPKKELPWIVLNSLEQLDTITELSKTKPVVIFKHSTRCGISSMTKRQFESNYEVPENTIALYYLDLIANREISNQVAIRFQVLHQSPQMLVIQNGNTVHAASHYEIQATTINRFI